MSETNEAQVVEQEAQANETSVPNPSDQISKTMLKKIKALTKDALVKQVLALSDAFEMQKMANALLHKSYQAKIVELTSKLENLNAGDKTSSEISKEQNGAK